MDGVNEVAGEAIDIRSMEGYQGPTEYDSLDYRGIGNPKPDRVVGYLSKTTSPEATVNQLKQLLEDDFLTRPLFDLVAESEGLTASAFVKLLTSGNAFDLKALAESLAVSPLNFYVFKAVLELKALSDDPSMEYTLLSNLRPVDESSSVLQWSVEGLGDADREMVESAYELITLSAKGYEDPKEFDYTLKRNAMLDLLGRMLKTLPPSKFKLKRLLRALKLGLKAPNDPEWEYKFTLAWARNEYDMDDSPDDLYVRLLRIF